MVEDCGLGAYTEVLVLCFSVDTDYVVPLYGAGWETQLCGM